jgi:TATA-box binding protein (TBP) (component of TFIID and TFIIIB)
LPAIILRKTKPRATILLFRTGRALVIGLKNIESLEQISKKVAREISTILSLRKIEVVDFDVTNIMGVGALGMFNAS